MLNINAADLAKVEVKSNDFAPIPDGKYCAKLESALDEAKTSKAGKNYSAVNAQFKLVGGSYDNRRVFKSYIYQHETSAVAGDIGIQGLKQLFSALECSGDLTVVELMKSSKCVQIALKTKPDDQYGPQQSIVFVGPCDNCPVADCSGGNCAAPDSGDIF